MNDTNHPANREVILLHQPTDPPSGVKLMEVSHGFSFTPGPVLALIVQTDYESRYVQDPRTGTSSNVYVPVERKWALVAVDKDEVVTDLKREIAELRARVNEQDREIREFNLTRNALDAATVDRDHWKKEHERLSQVSSADERRLRKLEGDLAKVKRHIGEKQFSEALK